jgi:hypothetical protein
MPDAVNTGMLPYFGLGLLALWFIVAGRLFCGKACPLGMAQGRDCFRVWEYGNMTGACVLFSFAKVTWHNAKLSAKEGGKPGLVFVAYHPGNIA